MGKSQAYQSLTYMAIGSGGALTLAYVSQFFFGLEPCVLCLYQRVPYMLIIACFALALALPAARKILALLALLLLFGEMALASFHVAVERGLVTWETGCLDGGEVDSIDSLRESLLGKTAVPCDEPAFVFLGLSMAGWNIFYAFCLLILAYRIMTKKKK